MSARRGERPAAWAVAGLLALALLGCDDRPAAADPACEATSDCPGGLICAGARCVVPQACAETGECCPGAVCKGGACEALPPECDGACDALHRCVDGLCLRLPCDGGCPAGARCLAGTCHAEPPCRGRCGPDEACFAHRDDCRVAPPACAESCAPGFARVVEAPEAYTGPLCDMSEARCACVASPPIVPADYGRHASMAVRGGEPVFAAYDADFGDLVFVAGVERGAPRVTSLDGVPERGAVQADPAGPRGGRTDAGDDVGRHASLGVDGRGRAHVAYYDATRGDLRVVVGDATGRWSAPVVVDAEGDAGRDARLRVDRDGGVHVLYRFAGAGRTGLKYAYSNGDAPFSTLVVSEGPGEGEGHGVAPCMDIGPDGRVYAAFYDAALKRPFLARGDAGGFDVYALVAALAPDFPDDPGGRYANVGEHDLGRTCAIAAETPDLVTVALLDADTGALLAYRGPVEGPGALEVIDAGARGLRRFLGGDPAMVVEATGRPVVVYQDGTENDVLLNVRGAGGWGEPLVVASAGALGFYNSVVLDAENNELVIGTLQLATTQVGQAAHRLVVLRQDVPAF
jgi:hypothetical protein